MDNQTLGIIAAVVVIVGSVIYLNMGSGSSAPNGKDTAKKNGDVSKTADNKEKAKENVRIQVFCIDSIS